MRANQPRWRALAHGSLVLAVGAVLASAPVSLAKTHDLPTAESILDRYVEVTGGKAAHMKIKSRKMTGKLAVAQFGHSFEGKIEKHLQAPGYSHLVIDSPTFYQVSASNGKEAWEWLPRHGSGDSDHSHDSSEGTARMVSGAKKVRAIEEAQFHGSVLWRDLFKKVETVALADVEGKPAYEVRLTTKDDDQYTRFYDQETGRLIKTVRTIDVPHMGKTKVVTLLGDYREFDGVWLHTKVRQVLTSPQVGEGTQTWTYTEVQNNVKIAPTLFVVPDELES